MFRIATIIAIFGIGLQGLSHAQDSTAGGPAGIYQVVRHESLNSDTDALTNKEEALLGTDPRRWDPDADKVPDDVESLQKTNPWRMWSPPRISMATA